MTSRISVELVQKAAVLGAPILVAVSAPTRLALRVAEAAGMTLDRHRAPRRLRGFHASRPNYRARARRKT